MSNAYDAIIWQVAKNHSVDPALIKAIVAAESGFNARAYRAEPRVSDASYGLMQILLNTARQMGYTGGPEGLYVPETNIEMGTRYLQWQLQRYNGQVPFAVAAYNSGTAYTSGGKFVNQTYVDRVMAFYNKFRAEREAEKDKGVVLRTDAPQMGPVPFSPPVRIQAAADDEKVAASFETLLSDENQPWLIALGAAVLLTVLGGKGR